MDHYSVRELDRIEVITMEYQGYQLRFDHTTLNLYVIYHLPSSSVLQFCTEFSNILESDLLQPADKVLYLGDFNIHVDDSYNNDTITFMDILDSYNLENRITFPTHVKQQHLDLVIEDQTDSIIMQVERGFLLSDHFFIHTTISILKPKPKEMTVQFRKMKSIDQKEFCEDLKISLRRTEFVEDVQDLVAAYNLALLSTLDTHALLKRKRATKVKKQPWFYDRIKKEIILRHKKEKAYNKEPNEYTLNAFYQQRRYVSNVIKTAQKDFYVNKLSENKHDFKKVFKIANKLLFQNEEMPLPPCEDKKTLANQFNSFFMKKIEKIMETLVPTNTHPSNPVYLESEIETTVILPEFMPITLDATKKLILLAAPKSCKVDPIPTSLLRNHIDVLAPVIQKIINISITNGIVPANMKEALIRPLLQKSNLDPQHLKNFRPVSNLSFVSKLVERVVCEQLMNHVANAGKLEDLQSAYRSGHSTESALLKVKTDLLDAMDKQKVTCLVLLDLSAAFDTVSHQLLLNWLQF